MQQIANSELRIELPEPPLKYKLYIWRKKMGISYNEMLKTPAHVIIDDITMISLENQYSKPLKSEKK